jgi:PDZ domain/Aspartyl protease
MRLLGPFLAVLLCLAPALLADDGKKAEGKTYEIPYRLTDTKHVLVRAKINGKGPFNFIVDTGAPALFVSTAVCKKVGVEPDKSGTATFDRFEIEGGATVPQARARVQDIFQLEGMNGLGLAGVELHGILGYTLLARFRLTFDFTRDKMSWTTLDFKPPEPVGLEGGVKNAEGMDMLGGLMKMAGQLMGRKADPVVQLHGFLGMELADADGAATVKAVLAKSPAAKAGVKPGDRVTEFEGRAVKTTADLLRAAAKLTRGQGVEMNVVRDGETVSVQMKAGEGL